MPENKNIVMIASHILKYIQGACDEEEKAIVEEWLSNSENKANFDRIKKNNAQNLYDKHSIDISDIRSSFYKNFEKRKSISLRKIASYAAVISLLISFPILFYWVSQLKNEAKEIAQVEKKIELKYEAPVLMTSKGEEFLLSKDNLTKTIHENNGVRLNIKGDSLGYDIDAKTTEKIAYNTIKVPLCGNFNFKLSDNTKVWLNAGTTLKYPVPFHKNKREIFLDGEAYFEVTKNKEKPFVVNFSEGSVKVLGTKFNVKTYEGKPVTTTLVSGSVKVNDIHNNSVVLEPNDQAVFKAENIKIERVDPYLSILWKEGYFVYKMTRLDEILKELSNWYGFEYFYQNESAGEILYTARLKKFNDINEVLKILENTGNVKFRIKKNTVIVTR